MNIYFYDNFSSSYNRFGNPISKRLIELDDEIQIIYIHDNYDKGEVYFGDKLKDRVLIVKKNNVESVIDQKSPDAFVSFSFRIPDVYWTFFFNSMEVPTLQVQHGLYVTNYKRTLRFVLSEWKRIASYLNYLVKIFLKVNNKINTISILLKKDLAFLNFGNKIDRGIYSNSLILWGEYWYEWFKKNLFYDSKTNYYICGSFDFKLLNDKEKIIENDQESITYICQTLVEDGRLDSEIFEVFLDRLEEFVIKIDYNIYIKLHPRSNHKLYERFDKFTNVKFTNKMPISMIYIGHYSSLMTVCSYLKKHIIMITFPGHPVPDEFAHMTRNIQRYDDEIDINSLTEIPNINTEYYYKYEKYPFKKVANYILTEATK